MRRDCDQNTSLSTQPEERARHRVHDKLNRGGWHWNRTFSTWQHHAADYVTGLLMRELSIAGNFGHHSEGRRSCDAGQDSVHCFYRLLLIDSAEGFHR